MSGSSYGSDGVERLFFEEFASPATNNGFAENADADQFSKFFGRMTFRNLTLQGLLWSAREGHSDRVIWNGLQRSAFANGRTSRIRRSCSTTARYRTRWGIGSRVYLDWYGYDGDYVFDYSETDDPAPGRSTRTLRAGNWWGTELKLTRKRAAAKYADDRDRVSEQLPSGSVQLRPRAVRGTPRRPTLVDELGPLCPGRDRAPPDAASQRRRFVTITTTRSAARPIPGPG